MKTNQSVVCALVVALGLAVLGFFVFKGLENLGQKDRVVTVRGLAEKEVKADQVIWPIVYKTTGNDLKSIYSELNNANSKITSFLKLNGIPASDISQGTPQILDLQADRYNDAKGKARYNVTLIITVSTPKVDVARALMPRMSELLTQGIAIAGSDYDSQVQYTFTSLNKIKPQMIEDATLNARKAAEKFAKDSESSLGKIKSAQQGLFTIENRDQYTPYIKKVRVVTTVDYFLNS